MIDINKLTKKNIGDWVVYNNGFKKEKGRIKSWNDEFIFVVYKCAGAWDHYRDYTAAATRSVDLFWKKE